LGQEVGVVVIVVVVEEDSDFGMPATSGDDDKTGD
jgi:hypothetical protein